MRNFIIPLLICCTFGCTDGGSTDPNTGDGGNATTDGGNTDDGADTGEEVTGGNCGGPEPPEDSLWVCDEWTTGTPWPTAGGPVDLEACLTVDGWIYTLSEDGNTVFLSNPEDGREMSCELDD